MNQLRRLKLPGAHCAPLFLRKEPNEISNIRHRVQRVRLLREHQRAQVRNYLSSKQTDFNLDKLIAILIDFDLRSLPLPGQVLAVASRNINGGSFDVICSAGITTSREGAAGYYDAFATVLLPDTFVCGVKGGSRNARGLSTMLIS